MEDIAASNNSDVYENDQDLQQQIAHLVSNICTNNVSIAHSLRKLVDLIQSYTPEICSIPKPLKILNQHYHDLKTTHSNMPYSSDKKELADILSVLAACRKDEEDADAKLECLKYCTIGTLHNIGKWGWDYINILHGQVILQMLRTPSPDEHLDSVINQCLEFYFRNQSEIQACDLLMEIDRLDMLAKYMNVCIYQRVCLYLTSCARYVDNEEQEKIYAFVAEQYYHYREWVRAFILAMHTRNEPMLLKIFVNCYDPFMLKQLAFLASRQMQFVQLTCNVAIREELIKIMRNSHLSKLFLSMCQKLNIMEPKDPDDITKPWREIPLIHASSGCVLENYRRNLGKTFVNGFLNAAFGCDLLISGVMGKDWINKHQNEGMISATAALGLIYLWDVDRGLKDLNLHFCTENEYIKSGALLGFGVLNCRMRIETDPAFGMLVDYFENDNLILKNTAIFALGLAYIGTDRKDVSLLIMNALDATHNVETFALACLAAGMVNLCNCNTELFDAIMVKLLGWEDDDVFRSPQMVLVALSLGFIYLGRKDKMNDDSCKAVQSLEEPLKTIFTNMLYLCAYAGSGDVTIVQKMLGEIQTQTSEQKPFPFDHWRYELDSGLAQAIPVLALGCISLGEETGNDMCARILGSVGRYSNGPVKRAVPLSIAISSVSKPHYPVAEVLKKYAHDEDNDVACNAILALGYIAAGSNNSRIAEILCKLAAYHHRNPSELFMVRVAQGLVHLGKGTMTLNPVHSDMQLMDYCALAGLLIPLVAMLDPPQIILGQLQHLLFALAPAIMPRWLVTVDEKLNLQNVNVQIGQSIDDPVRPGAPKGLSGARVHKTPVLIGMEERVEMSSENFTSLSPILEGVCLVKKKRNTI